MSNYTTTKNGEEVHWYIRISDGGAGPSCVRRLRPLQRRQDLAGSAGRACMNRSMGDHFTNHPGVELSRDARLKCKCSGEAMVRIRVGGVRSNRSVHPRRYARRNQLLCWLFSFQGPLYSLVPCALRRLPCQQGAEPRFAERFQRALDQRIVGCFLHKRSFPSRSCQREWSTI